MSTVVTHSAPAVRVPRWSPAAGTAVAIAGIWIAVVFASVFSPDLIHGSDQDHLPLAAITWWFWGTIATAFAFVPLAARQRGVVLRGTLWFSLAAATGAVWLVATLLSIFTGYRETGADPTRFPVAAFVAPIVAMALTGLVAGFVTILVRRD
jgi:hypothetical protein